MDFKKIRELRKSANMSQDDLAQILQVNRATVSKYETGAIDPSLAQLCKIANALGVRIEDLMGGIQGFDSSADFDAAWKEATSRNSKPGYEAVTIYHKPGGEIQIIDHRKERLNQIYDQLDSARQGQLVKYGEFLLTDSENE